VHGSLDNRDDTDRGWDVEIAIPLAAVKGNHEAMKVTIPPQVGDRWNLNVVRAEKKKGAEHPAAASWSQIPYTDWHALGDMLTVAETGSGPSRILATADQVPKGRFSIAQGGAKRNPG
jgi:hypothetical protein